MKIKIALASLPFALAACPSPVTGRVPNCGQHQGTYYVGTSGIVDGGLDDAGCAQQCLASSGYSFVESCSSSTFDLGVLQVSCNYVIGCGTGRRPAGLDSMALASVDEVGRWLAHAAALEAASVAAFRILESELTAHGAPATLIEAARRSAADEIRHAEDVARLARRFGALPGAVEIAPQPIRSLEEIAVENAVEGGVRERYGAHVALLQARDAGDAETRALFAAIAPDELRHAELAGAVDDWSARKLNAAARRRVSEAKELARGQLVEELAVEPPADLRRAVGLPEATRAVELLVRITSS
jgi:hypothetical protein